MEINDEIILIRTDSSNKDFQKLVVFLDRELGENYSEEYDFYNQYNQIDDIKNVIVVYDKGQPVSCGAIKKYDSNTMEVKRMYTLPEFRGMRLASRVLGELEKWAAELMYKNCILETGIKQVAAMAMYKKKGYSVIPNYGQYEGVANSVCFIKANLHLFK